MRSPSEARSARQPAQRDLIRHPPRGGSADATFPVRGEGFAGANRRATKGRPYGCGTKRRSVPTSPVQGEVSPGVSRKPGDGGVVPSSVGDPIGGRPQGRSEAEGTPPARGRTWARIRRAGFCLPPAGGRWRAAPDEVPERSEVCPSTGAKRPHPSSASRGIGGCHLPRARGRLCGRESAGDQRSPLRVRDETAERSNLPCARGG